MIVRIEAWRYKKEMSDADKRIASYNAEKSFTQFHNQFPELKSLDMQSMFVGKATEDFVIIATFENEAAHANYLKNIFLSQIMKTMDEVSESHNYYSFARQDTDPTI